MLYTHTDAGGRETAKTTRRAQKKIKARTPTSIAYIRTDDNCVVPGSSPGYGDSHDSSIGRAQV